MTSVDTYPEFGIDRKMGTNMKGLHTKIDALLAQIDYLKGNATEFKNGYDEQLKSKKNFYNTQSAWEKRRGLDKDDKHEKTLSDDHIKDIKYGAQQLKISLKEKYLGRLPGTKRGESQVEYSSGTLTCIMSFSMIIILGYVNYQVN